ncbi:DUF3592 domain-containing protein [Amycolatopsis sp. NPDC101161]|uniref:DUF3592 domain-containing protein n=1 Tax=Amycolatopsis sp. NPDC101161 TaxID=3363940 RepID=UPI0037FCBD3C
MLVFLFFGAGTAYSLLTPDYAFADGELLGEAVILTGSLALAAFGVRRLRAADVRLRDSVPDFGAWLPGRDGSHGEDRVDLGARTARLRRTARRATAIAGAWAVLFAGGLATVIAADHAAADLLATGVHTEGTVLSVGKQGRGTPTFWVRYHSPGASWTEEIVRDSGRAYQEGEAVTVVYDPADPAHVRTEDETNEDQVQYGFGMVAVLVALFGLPFWIGRAAGWWRRIRAVERTGWRRARVSEGPGPHDGRHLDAKFRDGTGVTLRRSWAFLRLSPSAGWKNKQAWVGGWGRTMVVGTEDAPYVLAVHATGERVSRSRP